ncbi:putative inactive receptor kinase [Camellia lanceoleosa]|uniref:Inactive receptor kinase n=1 Tax=Camellia lanceoleosa TaxID=1840588 RepID=A0ACC0F4X2_9ERIC|nr:putative inactive receptor kinase [Camellia lanceoleosa]
MENFLLCGLPLNAYSLVIPPPSSSRTYCPAPGVPQNKAQKKKKITRGGIIVIAIGGSTVLFLVALIILLSCLKKKDSEGSGVLKGKASSGQRSKNPKDKEEFVSGVQEPERTGLFSLKAVIIILILRID